MDGTSADYARAVVLGIVQALSEFLPISSSGHLVIAERLLGGEVSSLTFDVGLHVGTLLAVLLYFWRDWAAIAVSATHDVAREGLRIARWQEPSRLGVWIALGTLPAVIAGALLQSTIETWFRAPAAVAVSLLVFSAVIWFADRRGAQQLALPDVTPRRALLVGLAQAVALIPGVSRSGITIAAARALHFERASAARFSFMLSAPAVAGAAVLTLGKALANGDAVAWGPLVVGAITSAVCGVLVIGALLRFLQTRSLAVFMAYRVVLGIAVLVAIEAGAL